jgi:hypothetical protein
MLVDHKATVSPRCQSEQQQRQQLKRTMHYQVVTRSFPCTLPAAVNETVVGKATEDDSASNDCSSHQQHGDFKGSEPRDDSNEQKPGSKRKRSRDESSPKKYRVFGYI